MPLSFLGNHGYRFRITTCVANMLTFSYPKRTGEQWVQGEQGYKGNRKSSEKKGTEDTGEQGEQGNKRTRGTGEKQHMYAKFMERQRANRPETFFRKLKQTS